MKSATIADKKPAISDETKSHSFFARHSTLLEISSLILLAVAIRLPWIFLTPISEAPDEGAHYWVIKFIFNNHRLPAYSDMVLDPAAAYYGALSPVSYIPHLFFGFLMPWFQPSLAFRFGSLAMGVASVLLARAIGKEVFPASRVVALAVPLFVAFHPQLVFVNGYSNNDSTTMAIASLAIYLSLRAVGRGLSSKMSIGLGLACGLLALGKPNVYSIFPVVGLAFVIASVLHKQSLSELFKKATLVSCTAALVSMPFFLKNWFCFKGDLIGMRTMLELWGNAYGIRKQFYFWPLIDNADWRFAAFTTYVGNLGNMSRLLPGKIYKYFGLAINLSLVGWLISPAMSYFRAGRRFSFNPIGSGMWLLLFLAAVFNFAALLASSAGLNSSGPPQGRYLFPAEAAIAALLVGGLNSLGGRALVIAFVALNVVASVLAIAMLMPVYHFDVNIMR